MDKTLDLYSGRCFRDSYDSSLITVSARDLLADERVSIGGVPILSLGYVVVLLLVY